MKVVLNDGTQFDIGGLKAVSDGVVLFADEEREETIGYLPSNQFQYILSRDVLSQIEQSRTAAGQQAGRSEPRPGQVGRPTGEQPTRTGQQAPGRQPQGQVNRQPGHYRTDQEPPHQQ